MELLTKHTTANNPVLKIVAATLFILFPVLGFAFGMQYQAMIDSSKIKYINKEKIVEVPQKETARDLIERCGKIPSTISIDREKFHLMSTPIWAPDCRHIAWSLWISGAMGMRYSGPRPEEGLYVYDDKTKQIKKIFTPKSPEENTEFKEWEGSNIIIFKQGGLKLYQYDLETQSMGEFK